MSADFGPQLIGETEKTLNAVLHQCLRGTGLTESQWVVMRIAVQMDAVADAAHLASAVADRVHLADSVEFVAELTRRGLLVEGRPTPAGRGLIAQVQTRIGERTAPIWHDLDAHDVVATTRVLTQVLDRARELLDAPAS